MKEKDEYLKAILRRNKRIKELVKSGGSHAAVGRIYQISRERVRQIINKKS